MGNYYFLCIVTIVKNVVVFFRNEVQTPGQEEENIGIVVDSNCVGDVCARYPLAGHPRKGWRPCEEPKCVIGEEEAILTKTLDVMWPGGSLQLVQFQFWQIGQNSNLANT